MLTVWQCSADQHGLGTSDNSKALGADAICTAIAACWCGQSAAGMPDELKALVVDIICTAFAVVWCGQYAAICQQDKNPKNA